MHTQEMMRAHPQLRGNIDDALIRCIEECYDCTQSCVACADASLGEKELADMLQSIRLCTDCADVCAATGAIATRCSGSDETVIRVMLEACTTTCAVCAEECEKHAKMHEHHRICAEACRSCEEACRKAMQSIPPMRSMAH